MLKNCVRIDLPETINKLPTIVREKIYTHSLQGVAKYMKNYYMQNYEENCTVQNCYICQNQ